MLLSNYQPLSPAPFGADLAIPKQFPPSAVVKHVPLPEI